MLEEGPSFRAYRTNSQFLLPSAPKKVPEESSRRFRYPQLDDTDHRGNASLRVSVRNNKSTSVTTKKVRSTSCLLSIVHGEFVFQFQFHSWNLFPDNMILKSRDFQTLRKR